jgi:ABC-type antimicrobial peptide transport system permease subunit
MRVSGLSRAQVGAYLLLRAEALAAGAFVSGALLAWVWMNTLYSGSAVYLFSVPIRPAVSLSLAAAYAVLTALSAAAGALVATAGLQRVSIASELRS